jgi:hypothetical protein
MSTEILGLTDILGEDGEADLLLGESDDVLGATIRRAMQRKLPAAVQSRGVVAQNREPTRGRELVLGFDSGAGTIAAAGTAAVNSSPQQVFRPERVSIPGTLAPNFLINSLTIGTSMQLLNATGVHAETFASIAQDVRLKMDTAQINSVVSFNVTNLSAAVVRFFASLIGPSVM